MDRQMNRQTMALVQMAWSHERWMVKRPSRQGDGLTHDCDCESKAVRTSHQDQPRILLLVAK
jgi:hypothetical protein